ncbi:MAG: BACON domain-containing carbohydrate-binding protein [Rikenellaceae bacterium]
MKIKNIKNNITRWAAALSVLASFAACSDDGQDGDWVDPRYRNIEDSYTLDASGDGEIKFEIQSNMAWEIFSDNPEWCTITPSTGEADILSEVTVKYNPYYELDAREDVINLKSDYWTFKQIPVTQIGVATLTIYDIDNEIEKVADARGEFSLDVNQDWHLDVEQSGDWFALTDETPTEGKAMLDDDGKYITQKLTIAYTAEENIGEKRVARVNLYDRHDEKIYALDITQAGLTLEPASGESSFIFESTESTSTEIEINANVEWGAYIASDVSWLTNLVADETNGKITFDLAANSSTSARAAYIMLQSDPATAVEPQLTKFITIIQGSNSSRQVFNDFGSVSPSADNFYQYVGDAPTQVTDANSDNGDGYWDYILNGRVMTYGVAAPYGLYELEVSHLQNVGTDGISTDNFFLTCQFNSNSSDVIHFCINMGSIVSSYVVSGTTTTSSTLISSIDADFDYEAKNFMGLSVTQGSSGYLDYAWYLNGELVKSIAGFSWLNDYWFGINEANTGTGSGILNVIFGGNAGTDPAKLRAYTLYYTAPATYDATPTIHPNYEDEFNAAL